MGFNKDQAVYMVEKLITETQHAINKKQISPNEDSFHVFKIIAHAGKHSTEGKGILKKEIRNYLTLKSY